MGDEISFALWTKKDDEKGRMRQFEFLFRLQPEGTFGLPEEETVVIPAKDKKYLTPVIDTLTGNIVSHGTLSKFREDAEILNSEFTIDGVKLKFHDNLLTLSLSSDSFSDAHKRAIGIVDKILKLLLVQGVTRLESYLLQVTDETKKSYPIPQPTFKARVRMYDITSLSKTISNAVYAASHIDETLNKALNYLDHAAFLHEEMRENPMGREWRYAQSEIFLNLYKAVSTILGDPSKDKDYQSRYKKYGIDYNYWSKEIEWMRDIRNVSDVAHYESSEGKLKELEKNVGKAIGITRTVIQAYIKSKIEGRA